MWNGTHKYQKAQKTGTERGESCDAALAGGGCGCEVGKVMMFGASGNSSPQRCLRALLHEIETRVESGLVSLLVGVAEESQSPYRVGALLER
ncbi:hypothetical protein SLA2020_355750 [Shorea laevis]